MKSYLETAWASVKPLWAVFATVASYVLFPDQAYVPAAIGLAGAVLLDILTKYYALSKINGGFFNAIRYGHIRSSALWNGTVRKVISYLVVMILAGLSMRVSPIKQLATFFSTLVYSIMFLRESQSVMENLIEAGHTEWEWLHGWLKKQEDSRIKKALSKKDL